MEIQKFAQDLTLNIIRQSNAELETVSLKSLAYKESDVLTVNNNIELRKGIIFNNILQAAFLYKSVFHNFSCD